MSENIKIILPKKYLSYSAWSLWKRSKPQFRDRYYLNKPGFSTQETMFGKEIGEMLEANHGSLAHVPRFAKPEQRIDVNIAWNGYEVKILSYLDSFCPDTHAIIEYKTGHLAKGTDEVPWNDRKVQDHRQLDWYSMAVEEKFGSVESECRLVWLETDWVENFIEYKGHRLSKGRRLALTGRMEIFKRYIYEHQRSKIKEEIVKAAIEIAEDYRVWLEAGNEPPRKAVSPEEPAL